MAKKKITEKKPTISIEDVDNELNKLLKKAQRIPPQYRRIDGDSLIWLERNAHLYMLQSDSSIGILPLLKIRKKLVRQNIQIPKLTPEEQKKQELLFQKYSTYQENYEKRKKLLFPEITPPQVDNTKTENT